MVRKKHLLARIENLESEFKDLSKFDARLEIEKIKTHMISLRGLINRKLGKEADKESDESDRKEFKGGILPV